MRKLVCLSLAMFFSSCGQGENRSTNASNDLLVNEKPLAAVEEEALSPALTKKISVVFKPMLGDAPLACALDTQETNQVFKSIRFFLHNISFTTAEGEISKLSLDLLEDHSNLQFVDKAQQQIALLNLLGESCKTATAVKKMAVSGTVANLAYEKVSFSMGLPYKPRDVALSSVPSLMAPSDMGWMWQHFPADIQIDVVSKASAGKVAKMFNHLISDTKPVVTLDAKFEQDDKELVISMDLAKLYDGSVNDFVMGLESDCNNQVVAAETPTCVNALGAFGYKGEQKVFSVVTKE